MKVHCVYIPEIIVSIFQMSHLFQNDSESDCVHIPDAMMSIFRMSLLLEKHENALCLYSGSNAVYIPDVNSVKKTMRVHGVYIPDAISSIFRMSF